MGDSGRRDDYHLPSIRSLTADGSAQQQQQHQDPAVRQQQHQDPTVRQHQHQYQRHVDPAAYHQHHQHHQYHQHHQHQQHQQDPRYYGQAYAHPRGEMGGHSHVAAQSKAQSLGHTYTYHQAGGYDHMHHAHAAAPRGYGYRAHHAGDAAYAESSAQPAHPTAYHAPPSHAARYEGSQSLPASADHYRQPLPPPPYRTAYSGDQPMASPRDVAMRTQPQSPGFGPHYSHPQHAQYYRGAPELADRRHGLSPSSHSGYSAGSTPRPVAARDDAYAGERAAPGPTATTRPLAPPLTAPPPPLTAPPPPLTAPPPPLAAPPPLQRAAGDTPMRDGAASAAANTPQNDGDDCSDGDEVDEALLKRRKRNAQSAARLRERRKNREQELTTSCVKLESQIARLETELSDEKRRAIAELKGGRADGGKGPEAAAGTKRARPAVDGEGDLTMGEGDEAAKRMRPLRELDQVRLRDLKAKIETLGQLNQQVCVNLGVLRKEIQRISEAIVTQRERPRA